MRISLGPTLIFLAAPLIVQSSGTGGQPSFTLSASPSTITQKQGTLGSSTITATSMSYEGSVILTLTTNNPAVLADGCYVMNNISLSTNGTAYTTLTVYTAQSECGVSGGEDFSRYDGALRPGMHRFRQTGDRGGLAQSRPPVGAYLPTGGLALSGLLLFGFRRSRARRLAALGAVVLGGVTFGCGAPLPVVVPTGTYSLTVTGTDSVNGNLIASTNVTLIVD